MRETIGPCAHGEFGMGAPGMDGTHVDRGEGSGMTELGFKKGGGTIEDGGGDGAGMDGAAGAGGEVGAGDFGWVWEMLGLGGGGGGVGGDEEGGGGGGEGVVAFGAVDLEGGGEGVAYVGGVADGAEDVAGG